MKSNAIINLAIVDDSHIFRAGLAKILNEQEGFNVLLQASNGQDFLNQLKECKHQIDIALVDITMPLMNGYELILHLSQSKSAIKTICISVNDDYESVFNMIDVGARAYLVKDCSEEVLKNCIRKVKQEGRFFDNFVQDSIIEFNHHFQVDNGNNELYNINLTDRQKHFLLLNCSNRTYDEIAEEMNVSVRTVHGYRDSLYSKLKFKNRAVLAVYAIDVGVYLPKHAKTQLNFKVPERVAITSRNN